MIANDDDGCNNDENHGSRYHLCPLASMVMTTDDYDDNSRGWQALIFSGNKDHRR